MDANIHPNTNIIMSFNPISFPWKNKTIPPSTKAVKVSCERLKKYPASFSFRVLSRSFASAFAFCPSLKFPIAYFLLQS